MGKSRPSVKGTNPFARRGEISLSELANGLVTGTEETPTVEVQVVERVVEVEKIVEVPAQAIVPTDQGVWIGNIFVTATGLEISNDGVTEEEWRNFFPAVQSIQSALNWVYGDYFAYGEAAFQKSYQDMAQMTGLKAETIETYASICRNVPKLIRINSLTFGHHRLVAKYDTDTQQMWLHRALENKWSVRQMQNAIEGVSDRKLPPIADRKNKRILNRVWKAVESGGAGINREDIQHLRRWLDEVERMSR